MQTPRKPACAAARVGLSLVLAWLIGLSSAEAAEQHGRTPKSVLITYSGDSVIPVTREVQRGIAGAFSASERFDIALQAEYLDAYRFPNPEAAERFVSFLQSKYRNTEIDLLLTVGSRGLGSSPKSISTS